MNRRILPLLTCALLFTALTLSAQTRIMSDITENTTWTKANSPYILYGDDRQVAEGVTLTIEPGVVVKFFSWGNRFWINGHLDADGNPPPFDVLDPIVFTSYKDDQNGGDSNDNGDADAPAPGDWTSIVIADSASAFLRSCRFLYGGYWGNPMLDVRSEIDTIWSCRFAESNSAAIGATDYSLRVYNSSFKTGNGIRFLTSTNYQGNPKELILKDNDFEVDYLLVNAGSGDSVKIILEGNNLTRSSTTYEANVCTVFGTFSGDNYFKTQPDIPLVFSSIKIIEGASLTLPEGTIVKIPENTNMYFEGSLWAIGSKENPIFFTSIYDDSVGGDSNGESTDSNLEPGVWGYMEFNGINDSSRLENVIIKYAGQWEPGIQISNSNVLFNNCVISETGSYAMQIDGANPEIGYSTISNNNYGISVGFSGSPKIHHNDFMLNKPEYADGFGLKVDPMNPEAVYAKINYWGSSEGPKHYSDNPDGFGDLVTGPVDYIPLKTEMINDGLISKPVLKIQKNGNSISCRETSAFDFTDVLWEFGDGHSSTDVNASHTFPNLGRYDVCFTAISDYGIKVKQCQYVDLSTSSEEIKINQYVLSVFPNPANDYFSCQLNIEKTQEVEVGLCDISGNSIKSLFSSELSGGQHIFRFQTGNLSSGTYFIHAICNGKTETEKLIIR